MGKEADKGGCPVKPIDYETLSKLCAIMCTGEECASMLKIDYDTLNKGLKRDGHGGFTDYFKKNSARGLVSLRRKQFLTATEDGSVPMLIWLGKQFLDQKDKQEAESAGDTMTDAINKLIDKLPN
jgi:hypothetical protein